MMNSRLIASLIGPVLAAIGFAMLANHARFPALVGQLAHDPGLIFLSSVLSLVSGIAIVRVHNFWTGGWPVILTILGWLAVFGGLTRMWFPEKMAPIAESFAGNQTALMLGGVLVVILGLFLTYEGFSSRAP
jgi:hypothetical protein